MVWLLVVNLLCLMNYNDWLGSYIILPITPFFLMPSGPFLSPNFSAFFKQVFIWIRADTWLLLRGNCGHLCGNIIYKGKVRKEKREGAN